MHSFLWKTFQPITGISCTSMDARGIIELGGGYDTTDLRTYFTTTPPQITTVSVDGVANNPNSPNPADAADGEVMLDVEVAGSVVQTPKSWSTLPRSPSRGGWTC